MKKILGIVSILLVSMVACVVAIHFSSIAYCEQRKTVPTVIEYPRTQLVKKYVDFLDDSYSITIWPIELQEPHYSLVIYYYESTDPPNKIYEFYAAKGGYYPPVSGDYTEFVDGTAQPFGDYSIHADWSERKELTSYYVQIFWETCT